MAGPAAAQTSQDAVGGTKGKSVPLLPWKSAPAPEQREKLEF